MTRTLLPAVLLAALAVPGWAQSAPATRGAPGVAEFLLKDTRSMFSRYGSVPAPESGSRGAARMAETPARAPVFVGTMQFETEAVGLLEMPGAGSALPVRAGDIILWENTRIEAVSMDGLRVSDARGTRTVTPGNDLNNQPDRRSAAVPATSPLRDLQPSRSPAPGTRLSPRQDFRRGAASPGPSILSAEPALPAGSRDLMEQRMRERRALQDSSLQPGG